MFAKALRDPDGRRERILKARWITKVAAQVLSRFLLAFPRGKSTSSLFDIAVTMSADPIQARK